jgi:hypothetical protein
MKAILSASALTLASLITFGAGATELKPLQAGSYVLGSQSVSVFYTVDGDTYEVVATLAPVAGTGAPIRFVGFLRPGQSALISAGAFGTAAEPDTLELVHKGDRLSATAVTKVAAAQ